MPIMEGDLARAMEKHLARIAHIQLADNPGRREPGTSWKSQVGPEAEIW
jgi:hydroxypyruvate isomerase